MKKKLVTLACIAAVGWTGTTAFGAAEPDPAAVAADAVLGRPLYFGATIVGSALFLVSLPVAITSKSVHSTAEALVLKPARATFTRPLGNFDYSDPPEKQAADTKVAAKKTTR